MSDNKYQLRGVSAGKEDVHAAIASLDKGLFPKAFCKIVPDLLSGSPEHCLIMHADGAGTKSALAYMYWKETGDLDVWKGIAQDAVIMNVDDLICVGATENILLSSTIGRNKHLIPGAVIAAIINGTEEVLQNLRDNGISISSTGGETADVGDLVRTIIVDSTVVCRMERNKVISNDRIKAGNVIVGLCSYGKATYETAYNAGMGSNGLTSARHDVFNKSLAKKFPQSFDPALPESVVYTGGLNLTDQIAVSYLDKNQNLVHEKIDAANAAVVIGDRTFVLNSTCPYEYDLAGVWKQFTGLPFVFAAWVSTERLPKDFVSEFNAVLKYGTDHILQAIDENGPVKNLTKEKTVEYLTQRINYNLDEDKRKALNLFLDYIKRL